MNKKSLSALLVLSVFGLVSIVGCKNDTPKTSSNPISITSQETTTSAGNTTSQDVATSETTTLSETSNQTTTEVTKTALEAPVITVNTDGTGVIWTANSNAAKAQAKVDNGEYADATSVEFVKEEGTHTIKVKFLAAADGEYLDSQEATFTYEVCKASLQVSKIATNKVEWTTSNATKVTINDQDATGNEYEAVTSGDFVIKAIGKGFDSKDNKLYIDATETISLVSEGTTNLVIENVDHNSDGQLSEDWTIKKYTDAGWVDSGASAKAANGAMELNFNNNYTTFKYSKSYQATSSFGGIQLETYGNDISTLKVQLMNSETGVYATYNLGAVPSLNARHTIALDDANWKIVYGGQEYTAAQASAALKMFDETELASYFDTFSLLTYGETSNGASAKILVDNIQFVTGAQTTKTEFASVSLASSYIGAFTSEDGCESYRLTIGEKTIFEDLSGEMKLELQIEPIEGTNKFNLVNQGAVAFECTIKQNGKVINVKSLFTGEELALAPEAKVNETFEDGTVDGYYTSNKWKQQYYGNSGWVTTTNNIRSKQANTSKVINFYAAKGVTYTYTYSTGDLIGMANRISFKVGNYFATNETKVKVSYVTTDGKTIYLVGGEGDNFYSLPVTGTNTSGNKNLVPQTFDIDPAVIKEIKFTINGGASDRYLYLDDLVVEYYIEEEQEEENEPQKANINLNFNDGTVGSSAKTSNWTSAYFTSATETTSGGSMYYKTANDSTVINFYASKNLTYMYKYADGSSLGIANKISFDVGNYFAGAPVEVKVGFIDVDGETHYLVGSESEFFSLPVTGANTDGNRNLVPQSFTFDDVEIRSLVFVVKGLPEKEVYVYLDNLVVTYVEPVVE